MRIPSLVFFAVLLAAAGLPGPATAGASTAVDVDIRFTPTEVRIIQEFYADESPGRSGKKGGKGDLPPGIAKNLARGKALPPGIAKQVLPGDLVRRLPPAPHGYERIIVDGKILLVEIATQVVRDVLTDILFD
jgi:hypothetical protein